MLCFHYGGGGTLCLCKCVKLIKTCLLEAKISVYLFVADCTEFGVGAVWY